jgi:predicted Zn-dependent protease
MSQNTPLLDELAAHSQAFIAELRASAGSKKLNTELLDTLYGLAYNTLKSQKYQEAQVLFTYLLAQNPAESNYFAGMGYALAGLNDLNSASVMHATAAALNPDNAGHYVALAEALIALKDLEKAEGVLAAAEAAGAPSPTVHKLRAKQHAVKELMAHAG